MCDMIVFPEHLSGLYDQLLVIFSFTPVFIQFGPFSPLFWFTFGVSFSLIEMYLVFNPKPFFRFELEINN